MDMCHITGSTVRIYSPWITHLIELNGRAKCSRRAASRPQAQASTGQASLHAIQCCDCQGSQDVPLKGDSGEVLRAPA